MEKQLLFYYLHLLTTFSEGKQNKSFGCSYDDHGFVSFFLDGWKTSIKFQPIWRSVAFTTIVVQCRKHRFRISLLADHSPLSCVNVDWKPIAYRELKLVEIANFFDHVHISQISITAVGFYDKKKTFKIFMIRAWRVRQILKQNVCYGSMCLLLL